MRCWNGLFRSSQYTLFSANRIHLCFLLRTQFRYCNNIVGWQTMTSLIKVSVEYRIVGSICCICMLIILLKKAWFFFLNLFGFHFFRDTLFNFFFFFLSGNTLGGGYRVTYTMSKIKWKSVLLLELRMTHWHWLHTRHLVARAWWSQLARQSASQWWKSPRLA